MARCKVLLFAVCVLVFSLGAGVSAFELDWQDIGRGNTDFRAVLFEPDNPLVIYAGVSGKVLKSEDGGSNWRDALVIKGQNIALNCLADDPVDKKSVFAGSGSGLFYSRNAGAGWKRIFQGEVTALAVFFGKIYLGSGNGLFVSRDKGRTWNKAGGKIGNTRILAFAYSRQEPGILYAASLEGVFKSKDAGATWEEVFIASPMENGDDGDEEVEDRDEEERTSDIRHIVLDPGNPERLYLATAKGAYKSEDRGLTWKPVSSYGLLSREINFLLVSARSEVYAATRSGVFKYTAERWQELSFGLSAEGVCFLVRDKQGNLYAASRQGLFKSGMVLSGRESVNPRDHLSGEPDIREIQEAAIAYAEVGNEKIKKWRQAAAKKAWLPQVSVGVDRNTTDLWHWEGGSTTKSDDDTLRRGDDSVDWDVRLVWDLGELVWNDDQTNIDVRSKLMAQLRDNILDQVTKTYFERLRVKMELASLGIEENKKRVDKELRIRELTAMLDASTGGYFSLCLRGEVRSQ